MLENNWGKDPHFNCKSPQCNCNKAITFFYTWAPRSYRSPCSSRKTTICCCDLSQGCYILTCGDASITLNRAGTERLEALLLSTLSTVTTSDVTPSGELQYIFQDPVVDGDVCYLHTQTHSVTNVSAALSDGARFSGKNSNDQWHYGNMGTLQGKSKKFKLLTLNLFFMDMQRLGLC